jgi:hypothetical protein
VAILGQLVSTFTWGIFMVTGIATPVQFYVILTELTAMSNFFGGLPPIILYALRQNRK